MALSSLTLRLISSAILIPIVIGIIYIGGWVFAGFATLCMAIALYEWINITKHIKTTSLKKNLLYFAGIVYLGFSLWEIIYLSTLPDGSLTIILFMALIWSSDSGAYLLGKTIGGSKMSPTISPNKTWAGYVGALLAPGIILILIPIIDTFFATIDTPISPYILLLIFIGMLIGISGQSGDLLISAMKRKAGVKDTGTLIPGHGGILDRIDSLLMALPIFIALVKFSMSF